MGALLSFLIVSGVLGKTNISGVETAIDVPDEIYAKHEIPLSISIYNRKKLSPAFLLRVTVQGKTVLVPYVGRGRMKSRFLAVTFDGRGMRTIEDIHVCSAFPFNFFVRCTRSLLSFQCVVFPVPRQQPGAYVSDGEYHDQGDGRTDRRGGDPDIFSIRDYMTGDPLRYINWKASARTGRLKTKEFTSPSVEPVIIDFERVDIADLELKLSHVTFMVDSLSRRQVPVGLKIGTSMFKPGLSRPHKIRLLREIACYEGHTD